MMTSRTDGAAARSRRWCELLDDWAVSECPVQTGSRDGETLNTTHERNVSVIVQSTLSELCRLVSVIP